ncbi:hypothetical protein BKA66DRAFT_552396 [Pyrenochaeta sp. MPI-SDFR-AT-0127]|nr:hypothetical protein BKA66DRAFT_552396 [Pyrenochaeta sp. MPI-SDFR-AT-0127]
MAALLAMAKLLLCIATLIILVAAAPRVNYPLNHQFPPIAHVEKQFNFQFAPTTFSSDSDNLYYSLIGSPTWLSLDSQSRTLSGTPRTSDVGTVSFTITAAGQAGAVANMESKLIVSADDTLEAKENITAELSTAGKVTGPKTVILKPSAPFVITFPLDTFSPTIKKLSYFATLVDHTPLPAWISFDPASIHFAGIAPPPESPQTIKILLIACETPGFAASSVTFTMMISDHSLNFKPPTQTINIPKGGEVRVVGLKKKLYFDDLPILENELQSAAVDTPSWLAFDNRTLEFSGTAPSDLMSQKLTVTAMDQHGDIAEHTIHLAFISDLFAGEFGVISITVGQDFEYRLPQSTFAKDYQSVTVDFMSLAEYLHFDSATLAISGTIPAEFPSQDADCSITVISNDGTVKDTRSFRIKILGARDGSEKPNGAGTLYTQGQRSVGKKDAVIVGSVIGAVTGLLLLIAIALCLRRRGKEIKSYISPKFTRSLRKSDISRPTLIPYRWPTTGDTVDQDLEKGEEDKTHFAERTPEQAPKLNLNLLADRRDSHSLADSIDDASTRILDIHEESSYGHQNDIAPSQHPHDSMRIPTELAKRASQKSDTFRRHKRQTTTVYQDQIHRSTGLPVNRRITGMGHGRNTYSPSRSNIHFSRSSIRRPLSTSSYTTTRCTSTFSTAPSAPAQSPAVRKHTTMVTTPSEERRSVRVIPASIRSSLMDRRTTDEKRDSYIRKRASAQSPFFSAGTRASSSTYKSPPAFIAEVQSSPRAALSPTTRNTVVRPDDEVVAGREKELPQSLRIVKPSEAIMDRPKQKFPGTLRTNRINRPFTTVPVNRVEKSYARPNTAVSFGMSSFGRRASTRQSLRAYDLKTSLNDLTGSKVFEDAEMSDSVYSDEERDIEEAEKRTTVKPGQYTLPPLNLDRVDTVRNSKRDSNSAKRKSKRDSKRELKRTSERDPTPYYLEAGLEHGGKENASSMYSLGQKSSPTRIELKGKAKDATLPHYPKASATHRSHIAPEARKSHRASVKRTSNLPSSQEPLKERHSRKSIHSRSQSYQSDGGIIGKKPREHSRTQSSAYPYFDNTTFEPTGNNRVSTGNAIARASDAEHLPLSNTKPSMMTRDLSGNLTFYGSDDDEPTIEELGSGSIGFRTSNGRVSATARQSRLASLHLSSQQQVPQLPPKSAKRETVVRLPSSTSQATALGLYPQVAAGDRGRPRSPLSTMQSGSEETQVTDEPQANGRKTWGSWKGIMGRGSRWVSGGYWEKQGKDDKVFI